MRRHNRWLGLLATVAIGIAMPSSGEGVELEAVSPGASGDFAGVENRCPTFSWEAASNAKWYELVVYELPSESEMVPTSDADTAIEVFSARVPGGALSWTPPLESGLKRGTDYVWYVRAILDEGQLDADGSSDWSDPLFFSIAATPSGTEVEQALRVIAAYVDAGGELEPEPQIGVRSDVSSSNRRQSAGDSAMGRHTRDGLKSVGAATAAIRGEVPGPTGEAYGVVGVGNSPDGAGLGAVNTSGGADLILDGSADGQTDTAVSQSGIARNSAGAETFAISNTGGGVIDLSVQGGVSAASLAGDGSGIGNVNAATLDGFDSEEFATETELATSGGADVHWDNLTAVPPGLDDGDDDTTYIFGGGVVLNGDVVSIDQSAFLTRINTLDSDDNVGNHPSIAIGVDGLGLISYYDLTNQDLKVAHCADTACATADEITTLDSVGNVGLFTSLAIGADGRGLISYISGDGALKVAHCSDTKCTSADAVNTVDDAGSIILWTSIAVGADGLGLITYRDETGPTLKVAHCSNIPCTSADVITPVSPIGNPVFHSVTIGVDGLGLISYGNGPDLRVVHCTAADCSSFTISTPITIVPEDIVLFTSITIGADGLGLISSYSYNGGVGTRELWVSHCDDAACTSAVSNAQTFSGDSGYSSSVAIGADGLGLVSYFDDTNLRLMAAHCRDTVCRSTAVAVLDEVASVSNQDKNTSIAVGVDGRGLIAFFDPGPGDLKVAHLGIGDP